MNYTVRMKGKVEEKTSEKDGLWPTLEELKNSDLFQNL